MPKMYDQYRTRKIADLREDLKHERCPQKKADLMTRIQVLEFGKALPYPWCIGAPSKQDCAEAGRCKRNPSCGD